MGSAKGCVTGRYWSSQSPEEMASGIKAETQQVRLGTRRFL